MSSLSGFSLVLGLAIALWCGWYCRHLAPEKGRRRSLWTVLGVVLNVVAVPLLLALPPAGLEEGREPDQQEETEAPRDA